MFAFERLRRIVAKIFDSPLPDGPADPPDDPNAGVRVPIRRGRPGGSSAIALVVPDESHAADADAGSNIRLSGASALRTD